MLKKSRSTKCFLPFQLTFLREIQNAQFFLAQLLFRFYNQRNSASMSLTVRSSVFPCARVKTENSHHPTLSSCLFTYLIVLPLVKLDLLI